jgi:uncharacterized protein (TIGR03118 family)
MVFMRRFFGMAGAVALAWLALAPSFSRAEFYFQRNLVADNNNFVTAGAYDPNLVNPWGITYFPGNPFWVSDNNSGLSTLYTGNGTVIPFAVSIPGPGGTAGAPTGIVANGGNNFQGDFFIWAAEDGTISGWQGGPSATARVPGVDANVYKGLAMGTTGGNDFIYATNFRQGQVDVYDGNYNLVKSFTDPNLPAGYAPFGIQNINGQLFVTFALQNGAKHDDVAGPGHGFVDIFGLDGTLQTELISMGQLNSPWGLAVAPSNFGPFSNDLLVGNFGNSTINAFDPTSGAFKGTLFDQNNNPLVLTNPGGSKGLWGLKFGGGGDSGDPNTLFFTSGINDESDGLFGSVEFTPEPGTALLGLLGGLGLYGFRVWRRRRGS